jgi:hypothetical protein
MRIASLQLCGLKIITSGNGNLFSNKTVLIAKMRRVKFRPDLGRVYKTILLLLLGHVFDDIY